MWVLRVSHSAVVDAWRERERELVRRGHRVGVVAAKAWPEGGRLVRLEPREDEEVVGARTIGIHPALFVFDPRPLWRALADPVDVIDIHEEPFSLATAEVLVLRTIRKQRAPYSLYSAQNIEKRYPPPFRWVERWALRHARGVAVCNAEAGRIVQSKGFPGRARVIDLGTDLAAFRPDEATPGRPVAKDRPVTVGFAGRLEASKGIHVLLEALALDPALELRVAGDGPERVRLETVSQKLGVADRVEMLGALQAERLPDFYRSVDVLAVPSLSTLSWVEQFGRVALEAMACGTPVVVSDSGALPEVVGPAAIVTAEGNASELAQALGTVGRDPETAARLRRAGLARAADSSWERVAAQYEAMYAAATHETSVSRPRHSAEAASTVPTQALEVLLVAYGRPDLLARALEPLCAFSVTVVDNSSAVEVRSVCEQAGVSYVDAGCNGGFAAGVNEGLRRVHPDADVLLVNPDAIVAHHDITLLREALAADPLLASVAPAQTDGRGVPSRVAWPFPSPAATWLDALGLGRLRRDRYVVGSVLLLRRDALEHVGGFDEERFFLYAEETDWAYRAELLGWRHALVPAARAIHVGGATSTDEARRETHFHAAQEIYIRKHFGTVGWQVSRAGQIVGSAVRALILTGERGAAARRRLRLYITGPAKAEVRPSGARVVGRLVAAPDDPPHASTASVGGANERPVVGGASWPS